MRDDTPDAGLPADFIAHVDETGLIPRGAHVLVAVSGGLDSTVLLHLLKTGSVRSAWRLRVAHFDHAMRAGSAADAAFVTSLCDAWAVPCTVERTTSPLTGESAARAARYAFLNEVADNTGADCIATAHHADDQVETVLFRLLRGTGLDGLAGIPERRGRLVRPLLPFDRARIESYARAARLTWRDDPTNADPGHATRNRIRHELLPALERIRPDVRSSLLAVSREAATARAAWREIINGVENAVTTGASNCEVQLARDALLGYHPHIRARVIRRLCARLGFVPGRAATDAALDFIATGVSGRAIQLARGLRLERAFDRLVLGPSPEDATRDRPVMVTTAGAGQGVAVIGGRRVHVAWRLTDAPAAGSLAFDPRALRFPLEVRGWRPGDRIRLRAGTKKLKKLFVERRVPRRDRRRTPVLVQGDGRVLCVAGLGCTRGVEPVPGNPVFEMMLHGAGSF